MRLPALLIAGLLLRCYVPACAQPSPAPLGEAAQDRAQSVAQFALGKTLYERGDLSGALKAYQRAWRWDPTQPTPLKEIIPLAASLGQEDVAIRYALLQAEHGFATPEMLRRLALHATQQQEWRQAAELYRLWLSQTRETENPFSRTLVLIERGRLEMIAGYARDASALFAEAQDALLAPPNSELARRVTAALGGDASPTLESFARCHFEAGEPQRAAAVVAALTESTSPSPRAGYWAARVALQQQQPLEALSLLRAFLEVSSGSLGAEPYELLRACLVQLNETDRVEPELNALRELHTHCPYLIATLARRSEKLGNRADARKHYQELIDAASPDSPIEMTEELFTEAGEWLLRDAWAAGEPNRILPLLTRLCQIDPLLSLFDKPISDLSQDGLFRQALAKRIQSPQVANADATGDQLLARRRIALAVGELELALETLKLAARERTEDLRAIALQTAVSFIVDDQPEWAVKTLGWARAEGVLAQDDADAWFYQATASAMQEDFGAALQAAKKAEELDPESAEFAAQAAWVLRRAERTKDAINAYSGVIDRFDEKTDTNTRRSVREARTNLGYLLLSQGKKQQSEELLLQVLDEFPQDPGALNDLGFQWADGREHLNRALAMVQQAAESDPENAAYQDSLGWALCRVGRVEEALAAIENALRLDGNDQPHDPEVLYHYGEVLLASGDRSAAIAALRDADKQLSQDDARSNLARRVRESLATAEAESNATEPNQTPITEAP